MNQTAGAASAIKPIDAPGAIPPIELAEAPTRLDYLDGLRGLAALYVLLHHTWQRCTQDVAALALPQWSHWFTRWLGWGHYGVAVFIVLSGYCLMLPVSRSQDGTMRGGVRQFFIRRARRILPPYYATLVLALLLMAFIPSRFWAGYSDKAFDPIVLSTHVFLVHNFFQQTNLRIDPPMWSVATEWQIYFLFPLLLLPIWKRFGLATLILVAVLSGQLLRHVCEGAVPQYIGLFAFGMAGCILSNRAQVRSLPWTLLAVSTFCAFLLAVPHEDQHRWTKMWILDYLVGAATTLLLIALASPRPPLLLLRVLTSRSAVILGTFSYSLYLTHALILVLIHEMMIGLSPSTHLWLIWGLGIPVCLGFAFVFHLVFERPFMPGRPRTERQAEVAAIISPAP